MRQVFVTKIDGQRGNFYYIKNCMKNGRLLKHSMSPSPLPPPPPPPPPTLPPPLSPPLTLVRQGLEKYLGYTYKKTS